MSLVGTYDALRQADIRVPPLATVAVAWSIHSHLPTAPRRASS